MLIDSHCHLYDTKLDKIRDEIISSLQKEDLFCISCGDGLASSKQCVELAKHPNIFATVGTHPHEANDFVIGDLETYKQLAKNKKVVAIGEIGLDYYYDFSPRERQKDILKKQIILASELSLPCVFHVREATKDFLDILSELSGHLRPSVVHSFNGSIDTAKILLKYGFYLSFNGISTFSNAKNVLDVISFVPLDRFLIETDSPYLAPVPHRGEVNRPNYVYLVAEKIAQVKGLPVEQIIDIANANAIRLFNLDIGGQNER